MRPFKIMANLVTAYAFLAVVAAQAPAADRVYWTDAGTGKVQRASLDGSAVQDLVAGLFGPQAIALDQQNGRMYWVEAGGNKVRRAGLDGSAMQDLVSSVGPADIALDVAGGKMYWTDVFVSGWIQRANADGSGVEDLNTVVGDREGIALDVPGGKMSIFLKKPTQTASRRRARRQGTTSNLIMVLSII